MPRKQDENLIPSSARTPSERREIAQRAGIASGKARREKKALRETMQELLTMKLKDKKLLEELAALGFTEKGITMQDAISAAMIQQAVKGNVKAYNAIKDTLYTKNENEIEESTEGGGATVNIILADTSGEKNDNSL